MARRAEGWKLELDARRGTYSVRFTHGGRRRHLATGETDPGKAARAAARLYAESVSGRRTPVASAKSAKLEDVTSLWLATVEPEIDPLTFKQYEMYCATHFHPFFVWTDRLTEPGCKDYSSHRLRKVSRSTVARELAVLRRICVFAHKRGWLAHVPMIEPLARRVQGRRVWERKTRVLTEAQVERLLAALPEQNTRGDRFAVRARWIVAWETGLRPATLDKLRAPGDYKKGAAELVIRDEADKARFGRSLPLTQRARDALDAVVPDVGAIFGRHDHRAFLEAAATAAGLEHVTPYDLRHSRLTLWASRSSDLTAIGYLAGHKHATTTSRYVHQAKQGAAAVLEAGRDSGRILAAAKRKKKR